MDRKRVYILKPVIDLLAAVAGLLLMGPVMLIIAVLIRYRLGSPVLFKQIRPGYKGEAFTIYKFRTMLDIRDKAGTLLADKERLSPLGKLLRRYSLDELPQLFNVLKGELSVVGPRPLLMEYLPLYTHDQARRHNVKPGITGWAQINGRNNISWNDRFILDVWYVDNQSLLLDIKILFMTLGKVLKSSDINQKGHVTAEKFSGSSLSGLKYDK